MTRTKLKDRLLPDYTKGEEISNCYSESWHGIILSVLFGTDNSTTFLVKNRLQKPYMKKAK